MAKRITAIFLLIVLLTAVGLLVYFTRSQTVTRQVQRQIERRLEGTGREAEVGVSEVDTNAGMIDLRDIRITEPNSQTPFITLPRLEARIDLSRFAQGRHTIIDRLILHRPSIRITKQGKRFNFSDLLQETTGGGGKLDVTHAQVIDGTATYHDRDQQLTVRLFGLDLQIRGHLARREARGAYHADRVTILRQGREIVLSQVAGNFRLKGDSLFFDLRGRGLGGTASGTGQIDGLGKPAPAWQIAVHATWGRWQAKVHGNQRRLAFNANSPREAVLHHVRLTGEILEPLGRLQWQATLLADRLVYRDAVLSPVRMSGEGNRHEGRLAGTAPTRWAGTIVRSTTLQADWQKPHLRFRLESAFVSGTGTLQTEAAWPFRVTFQVPVDALETLYAGLPEPLPVVVRATGEGEIKGLARQPWQAWQGRLELFLTVWRDGDSILTSGQPVLLTWHDQTLFLERVDLTGPAGKLNAHGHWSPTGRSRLAAAGTLDLALLAAAFPKHLPDAEGRAPFRLAVAGPPGDWQGELQVSKAWLNTRALPQNLQGLEADLVLSGDTLLIRRAFTRMEQGSVAVSGQMRLKGLRPTAYALEAAARGLFVGGRSFRGELDADLVLIGDAPAPLLAGDIRVLHATYFQDFPTGVERILTPPPPPAAPEPSRWQPWRLDVAVTGPGYLIIDNRQAELTLTGDLNLRGTLAQPVLLGRLETLDGQLRWQGRRYDVVRGTVDWIGGDPHFDVALTSRITPYEVSVLASGKRGNLDLQLSSTPPLPSLDILTLIATGQTRGDLRAQPLAVAGILAPELLAGTMQSLEQSLGLDLLAVTPAPASTIGNLLIGKQLTDRLRVELAQNLEDPAGREIRLHYRITGNLGLSLRQQSDGDYWMTIQMERWIR